MPPGLDGERVLLVGASGFVGVRLAECLGAYGAEVHALCRRLGSAGAARLATLPHVRLVWGDVRDASLLHRAADGCRYVINCAMPSFGGPREQEAIVVDGTRHVLEAARAARVARVVHFSSAAVHDPYRSGGTLREDSALDARFPYARLKIRAEAVVRESGAGLPVTVLRPTCVWGPFSGGWTASPADQIRRGLPFLPLGGRGVANTVYVDNLVDAVYLSLVEPQAIGETFLINDDEPRTWGDLFDAYARCLGTTVRFEEPREARWRLARVSLLNAAALARNLASGRTRIGLRAFREGYDHVPAIQKLAAGLPEMVKERMRRASSAAGSRPTTTGAAASDAYRPYFELPEPTRELYMARARYASDKAQTLLGWRSRVPFAEALARTCRWLEHTVHGA